MYAIVDIETTGGHANANGITEVAIRIHNGTEITERFETLINPGINIPVYIRALTGISNEMVQEAPSFNEVAHKIFALLHDKIFVAHNVNFDYSFLRHHLNAAGFELQTKKLCTVRLGRKILPGLPSYSLGKFCNHLGIVNSARHRAAGDAEATAILFSLLLQSDKEGHIKQSLNSRSREQSLPPNLAKSDFDKLPYTPGIYYFHNCKGKVIYVGKAKNIKQRVFSHFSNNNAGRQKQEFLRNIYSITFKECGTELMALIHEAVEIKRLWPSNNRSLKRYEHAYGLYLFEDQNGYKRLAIDKCRKSLSPLYTFNYILEGHNLLKRLINEFNLCARLCFIQSGPSCHANDGPECRVCSGKETSALYNQRVDNALAELKNSLPSFLLVDEGRSVQERSCVLMVNGKFYGTGFLETLPADNSLDWFKTQLTPYPANDYIRNLVYSHAQKFPDKIVML
ncbi:GIY-YIG nuclease family protein [Flavihumibacter sp. R14]|nr:GIY-YIG nuclease family protein [Flavihumibacter soli]